MSLYMYAFSEINGKDEEHIYFSLFPPSYCVDKCLSPLPSLSWCKENQHVCYGARTKQPAPGPSQQQQLQKKKAGNYQRKKKRSAGASSANIITRTGTKRYQYRRRRVLCSSSCSCSRGRHLFPFDAMQPRGISQLPSFLVLIHSKKQIVKRRRPPTVTWAGRVIPQRPELLLACYRVHAKRKALLQKNFT